MLRRVWTYQTRHGLWAIARSPDGCWHPMLDDEDLGSYHSPGSALEELVGGYSFWPGSGVDPSGCALPDELDDWFAHGGQS